MPANDVEFSLVKIKISRLVIHSVKILCSPALTSIIGTQVQFSDTVSGWAGWALAHPEFGASVNPIPTKGADYAHRITDCPPGLENLMASLRRVGP